MDIILGDESSDEAGRVGTPLPTHLDTPLRDHEPLLILERKVMDPRVKGFLRNKVKTAQVMLKEILRDSGFTGLNYSNINIGFASIQRDIYHSKQDLMLSGEYSDRLQTANRLAFENLNLQCQSLGIPGMPQCDNHSSATSLSDLTRLRFFFEDAVLLTGCPKEDMKRTHNAWTKIQPFLWKAVIGNIMFYVHKYIILIITPDSICLGTRDHLLGLSDVITQRGSVIHACLLAEVMKDNTYPSIELCERTFAWGDNILKDEGNQGYELLGQWESMCVGVLATLKEDPVWDNTLFLNQMKQEFIDGNVRRFPLWDLGVNILSQAGEQNWNQLTQLYGLYRIWGHPTVNSQKGIAKLKTYACKIKPINYTLVNEITINMKERFCLDYRARHNIWPRLDYSSLPESSYLRSCLATNGTLYLVDPRYYRYEWLNVRGLKTFEILPKYNLVKLLSDKAMSLSIDEIAPYLIKGSIGPAWSRSVLYKWLTSNYGDPAGFLRLISEEGFGPEETIVGVCPKERELKLFARLFGLLTMKKRMYVVLTEAMLAEHVIPYFPEITMLDDYITLMKKMYTTTSTSKAQSHISIFTSLDFQKWNSHMRDEETRQIFQFLDELFGLKNIYTRTHEMFNKSQLYLADGTYIPRLNDQGKLVEDENCWSGHLGGIEGLRQKGWTIFTVCILRHVMSKYGYTYSLMGQGDNQVLKINYPRDMGHNAIQHQHSLILETLDNILAQIGPPLKLSESWSSSNLFLYGKFPILNGVPLSMSLKRICRMFSLDNEGFPTLDSSLSALMANVQSACNFTNDIRIPFLLYSKEVVLSIKTYYDFNYLGQYPLKVEKIKDIAFGVPHHGRRLVTKFPNDLRAFRAIKVMSETLLRKMLLFPKILGGYSICLLGNLFSNGFPDPVSENICLLKKMYMQGFEQETIQSILSPMIKTWVEPDMLCEDPVSLNLLHPSSPKESIKRLVQKFLCNSEWINNPNFKEFLAIAFRRQKELCSALLTLKPCNPRIMHSIVESTLVGRAIQVVGQLDKTNTLTQMMISKAAVDAGKEVARTEQQYFFSVLCNLYMKGTYNWNQSVCSTQHAQKLRELSWNLPITGVTVAPIHEAFTMSITDERLCMNHIHADKGFFLLLPDQTCPIKKFRSKENIGQFTPFLGSRTEVKTQSYGRDLARKSQPLLKNAAELLSLINWGTDQHSELSQLITTIFSSLTDLNPELFIPTSGQISGSIEHRWDDASTKHGGNLSILYTSATFYHLSSNSLIGYQAQGVNYNLHFQALMGVAVCWASHHFTNNDLTPLHFHVDCLDCIQPINETKLDIDHHPWTELLVSLPGNPICWVSSDEIPLLSHVGGEMAPVKSLTEFDSRKRQAFYQIAAEKCITLLRKRTIEAGDGRMKPMVMGGMNISWNSKLTYRTFMEQVTLLLFNFFIYKADRAMWKGWKDREDVISHIMRVVNNLSFLQFTWSSTFYLSERLMDEMTHSPWVSPFPLDLPLSTRSIGQHTRQHCVNILETWLYYPEMVPDQSIWIASCSKVADYHPMLKATARAILASTDREYQVLREIYPLMKTLIGSQSLELGNNIKVEWMLKSMDFTGRRGQVSSLVPQIREWMISLPLLFINNHIDDLCKGLPLPESVSTHCLSSLSGELELLPETDHLIIPFESNQFHLPSEKIMIQDEHWDRSPLDIHNIQAKMYPSPTTGPYKLLECLRISRISPSGRVAAIADGAGGFSLTLSRFEEVSEVYYNTLIKPQDFLDQAAPNIIPPAFVGETIYRKKLIGLEYLYTGQSDILHPQFWVQLARISESGDFSLLCCDAEGGQAGSSYNGCNIIREVFTNSAALGIQQVIVKAYVKPLSLVHVYTSIIASVYKRGFLLKGAFSSSNNTEIYLIGITPLLVPRTSLITANYYIGPGQHKKKKNDLERTISYYLEKAHPVPSSVSSKYGKYLATRLMVDHDIRRLLIMFGNQTTEYYFPEDYIDTSMKGVVPIRFGRLTRRPATVNLLKQQLLKQWAQGWLIGLMSAFSLNSSELSAYYEKASLVVYATVPYWAFWVSPQRQRPALPSSKVMPISQLIQYHELKSIVRLSMLIRVNCNMLSRKGELTRQFHVPKNLTPVDKGINF